MSVADLAARFTAGFAAVTPEWRTIGREAEHPVVREDGSAGDIADLWPVLLRTGDETPKYEGALLVAAEGERYAFAAEVGKGTMEVVLAPQRDLHGVASAYEEAVGRLMLACAETGQTLLGYGIQPVTPATPEFMAPKQRYGVLLDIIGPQWLWFTLTASDQVHVNLGRDEMIAAANLGNLLAPVTVALCANSPVYEGADAGVCSAREHTMRVIDQGDHRHGMPGRPVRDAEDLMDSLARLRWLMKREGEANVPANGRPFLESLDGLGDDEARWKAFLLHEHYVWHSARPRSAHGTVELRAACQQPPSENMAATALGVGMLCAHVELARWLDERLGDQAWTTMRAWHAAAIRDGLAAPEPFPGLLAGVLDRCEAALMARGVGEERYLEPLRRRLAARKNPAQRAREAFAEGGVPALVALTRWG